MKYHELKLKKTKRPSKRLGRGIGSGKGKTAGRGTKGQRSRSGVSLKAGFEGGQNPLKQRIPKLRGFRSIHPKAIVLHTDQLNQLPAGTVTLESLKSAKLIDKDIRSVKLLSRGKVEKAYKVELGAASKSAIKLLESGGGSFTAASEGAKHEPK